MNLDSEYLVPTSHPKIRSYLSPFHVNAAQMKIYLNDLGEAVEEQDIARLVLLLKDLIPDYSPGAQLVDLALAMPPSGRVDAAHGIVFDQTANRTAHLNA